MLLVLSVVSIIAFALIDLPPGDYLTSYITQLEMDGARFTTEEVDALRRQYGLGQSFFVRYLKWVSGFIRGDLGHSYEWSRPVSDLIAERLPYTLTISILAVILTYTLAVPIGILSAVKQYSAWDYVFTVFGFVGLSIPEFMFALILMFFFFKWFGLSIGGLFSQEFRNLPFSFAKFVDMVKHLPVPLIVIAFIGTAGIIRVMRGCLLDELKKQYVVMAISKGNSFFKVLFKYPVRLALNPIVSTVGWLLPSLISGQTITAIVLDLPTIGPLLFSALLSQDMYLAGSLVMVLSLLTVIGIFLSDLLLLLIDPRIQYER
jgi:peptide/nickel transport system permease protein